MIKTMCKTCESDKRSIWTFRKFPELPEIAIVNWMHLKQCDECKTLWAEVPYEPYAMFNILIKWPFTEANFMAISKIEHALVLHEWHGLYLRENWLNLSDEDQKAINQWRHRTARQFNPIDKDFGRDPHKYIIKMDDLEQFVNDAIL